jgi:hypothetical protein
MSETALDAETRAACERMFELGRRAGLKLRRELEAQILERWVPTIPGAIPPPSSHTFPACPTLLAIALGERPCGHFEIRLVTINGTSVGKTWAPRITL